MKTESVQSMSVNPPARKRRGVKFESKVLLDDEQDHDDEREQGRAFDQAGGHDHGAANLAGGAGLAGDALHGGGGQLADAKTATDDGETTAESGCRDRRVLLGCPCAVCSWFGSGWMRRVDEF